MKITQHASLPERMASSSQTESESLAEEILDVSQKRRLTFSYHDHFLRCLSVDERGVDFVDLDLDEMIQVDPYEVHAPSKRSDKEVAALLTVFDNLEDRKEITR